MRVLVCGSRDWKWKGVIKRVLAQSGATTIIHGCCRGADRMAGEVAHELGLAVIACPADWQKHGKKAGPIRNQEMLEHKPAMVLAFCDDLDNSRGTKDMSHRAINAGVPVRVIRHD
jgi:hypothetical protein